MPCFILPGTAFQTCPNLHCQVSGVSLLVYEVDKHCPPRWLASDLISSIVSLFCKFSQTGHHELFIFI